MNEIKRNGKSKGRLWSIEKSEKEQEKDNKRRGKESKRKS